VDDPVRRPPPVGRGVRVSRAVLADQPRRLRYPSRRCDVPQVGHRLV